MVSIRKIFKKSPHPFLHGIHRPLDREFTYENLTVNTGGSIAFEESQQTGPGTIDNYGIKVGFTYKFGGKKENQLVSLKKKNLLENKVKELSYENDELKARVEKLEKIAIALTSNENPINVSNLYPNNTDHLIPTRGDL